MATIKFLLDVHFMYLYIYIYKTIFFFNFLTLLEK